MVFTNTPFILFYHVSLIATSCSYVCEGAGSRDPAAPAPPSNALWARQHGIEEDMRRVPLPVCAERSIKLIWPSARPYCTGFNAINNTGEARSRAFSAVLVTHTLPPCREAVRGAPGNAAVVPRYGTARSAHCKRGACAGRFRWLLPRGLLTFRP